VYTTCGFQVSGKKVGWKMSRSGFPTAEEFVTAWSLSRSVSEVCRRLNGDGFGEMSRKVVCRWAKTFRELGIPLKRMMCVSADGQ